MARYVLDTSAVLAALLDEPGAERINEIRVDAVISTVNLCEVASRLGEEGVTPEAIAATIDWLGLQAVPFGPRDALQAAQLRRQTRRQGLSLGDRACLALAMSESAIAVTADRIWGSLDVEVEVELIR